MATSNGALIPLADTIPQAVNPETLIAKAIEHGVSVDTLERLLALRDTLKKEQAREAFFAALTAAQGAFPIIPKTKVARITSKRTGQSYSYKFAPLDVIVATVTPVLQAHGLSATFDTVVTDGSLRSIVTVHHVAGHSQSSTFEVPIDKDGQMNAAQQVASANTYSKRYAYTNALGILTGDDDDDAHSAGPKVTGGPVQERVEFERCSHGVSLDDSCVYCINEEDARLRAEHRSEAAAGSTPPPPAQASPAAAPDLMGALQAGMEEAARKRNAQGSLTPELPPKSDTAISPGKSKRLYALIRSALGRHKNADTRANVEAVKDRIKQKFGLPHVDHLHWKDYDAACDMVEAFAEEVAKHG